MGFLTSRLICNLAKQKSVSMHLVFTTYRRDNLSVGLLLHITHYITDKICMLECYFVSKQNFSLILNTEASNYFHI